MACSLSSKLGLKDIADKLPDKRILLRVDYNVPLKDGSISDKTRILETIPTIKFLLSHKVKSIVLISHCGRPGGKKVPALSLRPVAEELSSILGGTKIEFLDDCVGESVDSFCEDPKHGTIIMLENLRFHAEEEGGKGVDQTLIESFRMSLSKLGDIFVNDAFGCAHRAHSSVVGIKIPLRVAGFLMKKELDYFSKVIESPTRPLVSILGGAKVKDKIKLISSMLEIVDSLFIGGGMAYTFKKVLIGMSIGDSLFDEEGAALVPEIMQKAKQRGVSISFPVDFKITTEFSQDGPLKIVTDSEGIPDGWMGLDCGPKTIEVIRSVLSPAKTIVWNGPLGVFEMPKFAEGSLKVLDMVVDFTEFGAISIIGGGDTAALAMQSERHSSFSHISTGGGASLELLEGKVLPGVQALSSR